MANTLLTSTIISKELLMQFENTLIMARKVDWSYNDKFGNGNDQIGSTYSVRVPALTTVTRNNMAYSAQAIVDKKVVVTVANSYTSGFSFSDGDLALKVEDFSRRYVKQATAVLAATFDKDIADTVINSYIGGDGSGNDVTGAPISGYNGGAWVVGDYNTALTTGSVLKAKELLLNSGCPDDGDIVGVLDPAANTQLSDAALKLFNAQEKIARVYTSGYIGDFAGIEFNVSQSLGAHTNGAAATIAVTSAAGNAKTVWAEYADLTVTALSGAVKAGDVFEATVYHVNPLTKTPTADKKQFTVVKDAASGATSVTVMPAPIVTGPDQNISATIASTTLTLKDSTGVTGREALIFHSKAIAAVSPKLEMPKKSSFDMAEQIDENELRMRFLRGYDAVGASGAVGFISRLDSYLGFKVLRGDWVVRMRHI